MELKFTEVKLKVIGVRQSFLCKWSFCEVLRKWQVHDQEGKGPQTVANFVGILVMSIAKVMVRSMVAGGCLPSLFSCTPKFLFSLYCFTHSWILHFV